MKLTDLSPRDKVVLITRVFFCSDHIKDYCESLGLRREDFSVDNLTTLAGGEVVDALVEGLEKGLAIGVKKITDQSHDASKSVSEMIQGLADWVNEDA